jgi:hypothetical protein
MAEERHKDADRAAPSEEQPITLTKNDGSGASITFATQAEADAWMEANPDYAVDDTAQADADARDENARSKAVAKGETEDKAVGSPSRQSSPSQKPNG